MNNNQRKYPKNPRQNANLVSLLTFWWTRKIFQIGYKKDLEEVDLYATLTQDETGHLGKIINKAWEKELESCTKKENGSKPQLLRVLIRCFGKPFLLIGLAEAIMELFSRREMNVIKKYSILKQLALTLDCYIPRLGLFLTILTYTSFGNYINAEKVYLITAYYNVLRNSMIFGFSMGLHQMVQILVCTRRLQRFMMHTEVIKKKEENSHQMNKESFALRMINVNAKWHGNSKDYTLCNINLTVLPGSFVAIIGQVGSGKSSLLQTILQELPLISGSIENCGRINYISQQPWIFASSVKQNILFGQTMDESRYNEVIKVCEMESDIDSFPQGDCTIVGERGINLSGGQRARINLARAIYKDADIYLLDDPLSAVDSHVSKRLVNNCICKRTHARTHKATRLHTLRPAEARFVSPLLSRTKS